MFSPLSKNILVGYTTQQRPYKVDDYPWGFKLRTSIHYWIESKPGKGDRFCSYTIDPKTGRACKPKYSTYAAFMYMYLDENNHVKYGVIDAYDKEKFEVRFEFLVNRIGVDYIEEVQKANLRVNYMNHLVGNFRWTFQKYSDEKKPEAMKWLNDTIKHIKTCDFKDLVSHPEQPAYDKPDEEVKFEIVEAKRII